MEDNYLGKRLDGRYEIDEIIGVGGMAVVYKGRDITENRTVAVKILKDEFAGNDQFVRRFWNEAKAISVLNHANIVKVYDASVSETVKYMVMEYIDGITLKEYIAEQGSLRWKDAVYFTAQILRALQHAHDKGIVHRDVKPQNIMLLEDGTVKVTDFGIARFARSTQKTLTDKAIGSVHYISPEQARGEKTDEKADIYSVGVILYEMLTGKLPFEADSAVSVAIMQLQNEPKHPCEIDPSIPKGVEQITMHAMEKEQRNRYASASEMLRDLDEFRKDPTRTFEFSYFVDEEPTRFVELEEKPAKTAKKPEEKEHEDRSMVLPILSGIAAAFLVAILVAGGILAYNLFGGGNGGTKVVDFTGHTYGQVVEYYGNVFTFEAKYEPSDTYEPGIVIKQSKSVGTRVKKAQIIVLTVSQGANQVDVPVLTGDLLAKATKSLEKLKLAYEIEYFETSVSTADTILSTTPAAGTSVAEGTVIKLVVAKTPGVPQVAVPDVTHSSLSSAKKSIESAGLTLNGDPIKVYANGIGMDGKKITVTTGLPQDYVCLQTPAASKEPSVPKGSAVTLYVSNGLNLYQATVSCAIDAKTVPADVKQFVAKCGSATVGKSAAVDPLTDDSASIDIELTSPYNQTRKTETIQVYAIGANDTETLYRTYSVNFETGAVTAQP